MFKTSSALYQENRIVYLRNLLVVVCCVGVFGCSDKGPAAPSDDPPAGGGALTAPQAQGPANEGQTTTLRPTLTVANATGGQGSRTYEFQISDDRGFPNTSALQLSSIGTYAVVITRTSVAEGSGTTSFTVDTDLQPATRFFWRARATQGGTTSDWTATRSFKSQIIGFNRPGALYDPLTNGQSVGTAVGPVEIVPDKGVRLATERAYIRYQLLQVLTNGEFSADIEGLYADAPGSKLKLFSMMDGQGDLLDSEWLMTVQYRGKDDGNPNNCITWKFVVGDSDARKFEPSRAERTDGVRGLDPSATYHWKATWGNEFRVSVRQGGATGNEIYNFGQLTQGV